MSPTGKYGTSLRCDTSPEATFDGRQLLMVFICHCEVKKIYCTVIIGTEVDCIFYYQSSFW